jgi:hypothetical protein
MITPGNELQPDDSDEFDAEDQQSQQDIHSNGFDDISGSPEKDNSADTDELDQAYKASEPAYTLNLDDIKPPTKKKE